MPTSLIPPDAVVRVALADRAYDIRLSTDGYAAVGAAAALRAKARSAFVITDTHVARPHATAVVARLTAAGFRTGQFACPPGEASKSLAMVEQLYGELFRFGADRKTLGVAVGGGVMGDLAGYVAATYLRGLPLLMVPTTLLAMVDSSVGGKVGVNFHGVKNLIGAFYQPVCVVIDTSALATLPSREFCSGLAEVVKYGVILDAEFFAKLETHADAILARDPTILREVICRCCELKAEVVRQDEREETGLRAILNYGHTFAHAFESVGGPTAWLHGEAVAAGMMCAARVARRRGGFSDDALHRQASLLQRFELPTRPKPWPTQRLLQAMKFDKKNANGRLRFILPIRLGAVRMYDDVASDDVLAVLAGPRG
jgi:3-dehydroquinate synthase